MRELFFFSAAYATWSHANDAKQSVRPDDQSHRGPAVLEVSRTRMMAERRNRPGSNRGLSLVLQHGHPALSSFLFGRPSENKAKRVR